MNEFKNWLQSEFEIRCRRNPSYSVRSLARQLKMDPSTVSQLLRGKRRASPRLIEKIVRELSGDPSELRSDDDLLGAMLGRTASYSFLEDKAVAVLSNWIYAAILESTFISDFRSDPVWIAKAIGVPTTQVQVALSQLLELGLIKKDMSGRYKKTDKHLTNFRPGQTSAARKDFQRSVVEMARRAIDEVRQEDKDITAMTFAIDKKNLERARLRIQRFRREMATLLESGEPSEVYQLSVQLFPVNFKK